MIPLLVNLIIVPVKMMPHVQLQMGQTNAFVPLASLAHCAKASIALQIHAEMVPLVPLMNVLVNLDSKAHYAKKWIAIQIHAKTVLHAYRMLALVHLASKEHYARPLIVNLMIVPAKTAEHAKK